MKSDKILNLPDERWTDCVGYEGYYMVSNLGRIRSVEREVSGSMKGGGSFRLGQKLMKFKIGSTGYLTLAMSRNGEKKYVLVHRIVASAFIPNPNNYPYINHKNFIRTDNRVGNLEWCTQKLNNRHAIENGRIPIVYGESTSCVKLTNQQVMEIFFADGLFGDIAKKYGITRGNVGCIKSGKIWSHLTGKKWVRQRPFIHRKPVLKFIEENDITHDKQ